MQQRKGRQDQRSLLAALMSIPHSEQTSCPTCATQYGSPFLKGEVFNMELNSRISRPMRLGRKASRGGKKYIQAVWDFGFLILFCVCGAGD